MATRKERNPSCLGPRPDVVRLVPWWCKSVPDVGCATRSFRRLLKESLGNVSVTGVELDPAMAEIGRGHLDVVVMGDVNEVLKRRSLGDATFDCIVRADVFEHLVDPWTALQHLTGRLEPSGVIVTSVPNVSTTRRS